MAPATLRTSDGNGPAKRSRSKYASRRGSSIIPLLRISLSRSSTVTGEGIGTHLGDADRGRSRELPGGQRSGCVARYPYYNSGPEKSGPNPELARNGQGIMIARFLCGARVIQVRQELRRSGSPIDGLRAA